MCKTLFEIFFDFFPLSAADPACMLLRENAVSVWLFSPSILPDSFAAFVHSSGRFILHVYVHPSARFISLQKTVFTNFAAISRPIFVILHNAAPPILYRLTCIPVFRFIALALHSIFAPLVKRQTSGLPRPPPDARPARAGHAKRSLPFQETPRLIPFCASCAPRTRA